MTAAAISEVTELNQQAIGAWTFFAQRSTAGSIVELDGVAAAFSKTELPFFNAMFLSSPVKDLADFRRRASAVLNFGRRSECGYMFGVCNEYLPVAIRDHAAVECSAMGLQALMPWTGMVADDLTPVTRNVPSLEFRPVRDEETILAISDLNSIAYGMPVERGRPAMARPELWDGMFGVVGYRDGKAVSCASTLSISGRLYVAFVATLPAHRGQGYAEAAMRDSLARATDATGLRRTTLHATDAGYPNYLRMGYRQVSRFTLYGPLTG